MITVVKNWAGNLEYGAQQFHEPPSLEELQEIVRTSSSVRALGSRHSFNDVADTTGDLVSLARMPRTIEIDRDAMTVTVDGGIRYGELCQRLDAEGFALHNLASLPHISVAGACATGTHGSGDRNGSLATAVVAMNVVRADGEMLSITGDDVAGAAVSLGALGVITALTLRIEPAYRVRQDVFEDLAIDAFADHFDALTASADSISFFTEWRGPAIDQVWLKRRVGEDRSADPPTDLFGAAPATEDRHPIRGAAEACTPQLGLVGAWHERLPHFRMDHTPSNGDELQSEYLLSRDHAVDALLALGAIRETIRPLIQVAEIRTIAADDLWVSMAHGRESVAFHFTWKADGQAVRRLLPEIEAALRPFEPRPHWGKVFTMPPTEVRSRYPRLPDFVELVRRHDPDGKFSNAFLDRFVFATPVASRGSRRPIRPC
jgi:xylitol oxidase